MSKHTRVPCLVLASTVLLNSLWPSAAVAETLTESGQDWEEPAAYTLTIPYYEEAKFGYDEKYLHHIYENKDVELTYEPGENVELSITENDGWLLDRLRFLKVTDDDVPLLDEEDEDWQDSNRVCTYNWLDDKTLTFTMPETDVVMKASFIMQQITPETDSPFDKADEVAETANDQCSEESGTSGILPETMDASPVTEAVPETDETTEQQKKIQKDSVENDGFPENGSLVQVDEISLTTDQTDFPYETTFEGLMYPQDTCKITFMYSDAKLGTEGHYNAVYRVDESSTGKFWYIVRPISIKGGAASDPANSEADAEGTNPESSDTERTDEAQTEVMTEQHTETSIKEEETPQTEAQTETQTEAQFEEETVAAANTGFVTVSVVDPADERKLQGFVYELIVAEDIKDSEGNVLTTAGDNGGALPLVKGTVLQSITSTDEPVRSRELYLGKYQLRQTHAPEGWSADAEVKDLELTLNADKRSEQPVVAADFESHPTTVQITLVSADEEAPLKGADVCIRKLEEGSEEGSSEEETESAEAETEEVDPSMIYTTDSEGRITLEKLLPGNYEVFQKTALAGYNLAAEKKQFTVDASGLINGDWQYAFRMENIPNVLQITKTDIATGKALPGAALVLKDSEGREVDTWESTGEAHALRAIAAGTYTLSETRTPEGYEPAEDLEITIEDKTDVQTAELVNAPYRKMRISVTAKESKKELTGVLMAVNDPEGKDVKSWTVGEDVYETTLPSGDYTLVCLTPVTGYVTPEEVPFTVAKTTADAHGVMDLSMSLMETDLEVSAFDGEGPKMMEGIELSVWNKDGEEIETWTSTQAAHRISSLPVGKYTLESSSIPAGYVSVQSVSFEILDTREVQKAEIKIMPLTVAIAKKDIADGEEGRMLKGAQLKLKDGSGKVIDTWESGEEEHQLTKLPAGKYTLIEITAPNGYEVADKVEFEIKDTEEIQHITMYDPPKEETVDLTGKTKTTKITGSYAPASSGYSGGGLASLVTGGYTSPVKTGDNSPLWLLVLALICSGGTVAAMWIRKSRRS